MQIRFKLRQGETFSVCDRFPGSQRLEDAGEIDDRPRYDKEPPGEIRRRLDRAVFVMFVADEPVGELNRQQNAHSASDD